MTVRELDQVHEKLDKMSEKMDNIIEILAGQRERLTRVESFQGFIKVGLTLAVPAALAIFKLIYDITRAM